jgi:hypothetical protein
MAQDSSSVHGNNCLRERERERERERQTDRHTHTHTHTHTHANSDLAKIEKWAKEQNAV